jgi:hypothetical protein
MAKILKGVGVKKSNAIIILGMHRSGTSAVSGSLAQLGLDFGSDLMGPRGSTCHRLHPVLDKKSIQRYAWGPISPTP